MRIRLLLLLLVVLGMAPAGLQAAVTAGQIMDTPVVVDHGATLSDADRALLEASATDLGSAEKTFPTRYVIVAAPPAKESMDEMALRLRVGMAKKVGIDNIDGVVVLAPRAIGISADAFKAEIADAEQKELTTLKEHPAQGAVNIMNRLQAADAAGALQVGEKAPDDGVSAWVWIVGGVVLALGVIAFVLARRAAKRGERARAAATEGSTGSDPEPSVDA